MRRRHAVVVGAGIGGLTAAIALHRRGWDVTVCERAPEPPTTGAGIGLAPNALRALQAIGVGAAHAVGTAVPATMGARRRDGRWLTRVGTAAMAARYGLAPLAVPRPAFTAAKRSKTVVTDVGPVQIEVPRDREGGFEPQIVKKRQRRL
ncbi:FAD-dependent oxidoreductase, partial [Streptomyces sp. NPDC019539]|uniref:FAD-dependent oxidoreductase n=1 Tax=Streptomyces sp. NPDC019539 TaxID=3365063 RepID=UPI00378BC115